MAKSDAKEGDKGPGAAVPGTGNAPVVGIGASAGGIQALQTFFDTLPQDTGAAFVVVVHLDPQSHSELAHILAARTSMPVVQVEKAEPLEANKVYVIPPDRRLCLTDHEISCAEFEEPHGHRAPIDLFFRSLADHGEGFAVVLTGAGSDGAIGVRAVKEAGGIVLVQDPAEAEYPSMPCNAIATGIADFVLPVRDLAARLGELLHNRGSVAILEGADGDEELVRRILTYLAVRTGHDFSRYRRSTVLRRIARRMQVTRATDLKAYDNTLRSNADEPQALLADLLISVTTFFRDAEAFETLRKLAIPALFEDKGPSDSIRVWVPGCATGEEAYSIAILLLEEASRREIKAGIQVFASDLDERALSMAREGRFPSTIEADVGENRLHRFFSREGEGFRVRQELRDTVLFASHDLLKDPPFSRLDLISCRNVLIYLERELQEQVCSTFNYALNPGGFLFLGTSETAENPPGLFKVVDRSARLYQSITHSGERPRLLPRLLASVGGREIAAAHGLLFPPSTATGGEVALHRQAIEALAPPSILVDEAHRVIHLSDNAGRFLQPAGGPLSGDAVDLVRPEIRFELRSALNRAFDRRQATLTLPILVRFNGASPHRVLVQVKPVGARGEAAPRHAVVMFIEGEAVDEAAAADQRQATDETVRRLTQELELTQSRLRTVREESEATNEELRAANEELQSINEEYRSTSEELETSREELQSINEEVQTVNTELKFKLEAVSRAHSDLQNLMAATDFGTLFLDSGLRIKRFTDRVTDLFSITPADEGRPITDFAHQLEYDDLIKDARTVLSELAPIRRDVRSRAGKWYDVRLRPYRTVDDKIDGVVITFIDISERRQVEQALEQTERQLAQQKRLVEMTRVPLFIWDFDDGIVEWNRGSEELYGYTRQEALGQKEEQLLLTTPPGADFAGVRAKLAQDGSWTGLLAQRTKDGRMLTCESRLQLERFDGKRLVLESARDITGLQRSHAAQALLLRALTDQERGMLDRVRAIAQETLREGPAGGDEAGRFEARLSALAVACRLLEEAQWKEADLATLARQEIASCGAAHPERFAAAGETVALPPDLAIQVGLALHEAMDSAARRGVFGAEGNAVKLSWTLAANAGERKLMLKWQETGPAIGAAAREDVAMIDRALPGAAIARSFGADDYVITVEVKLPVAQASPPSRPGPAGEAPGQRR